MRLKFRAFLKNAKVMEYPSNYHLFMWAESENQPMEIMQFTGLKDSKGIEIYEGDIVRYTDGRVVYVKWHKYTANFDSVGITSDGNPQPLSRMPNVYAKVIGNIYENPELLKDVPESQD